MDPTVIHPTETRSFTARQGLPPGGAGVRVGEIFTASSLGSANARHIERATGRETLTVDCRDGALVRRLTFRPVSHGNGFASYAELVAVTELPAPADD